MSTITQYLAEIKQDLGHALNGRIEAAGRIIASGKVAESDDHTWIVGSERDPHTRYMVTFHLGWSCTCQDCQGNGWHPAPVVEFCGGVQPTCKHILAAGAVWVAGLEGWRVGLDETEDPIPFDGRPVPYAQEVRRDYGIEPIF